MIKFTKNEYDDVVFLVKAQTITNAVIVELKPKEVFLFKVDNWFDAKWLNFTGKILGVIGKWDYKDQSRIPPFSPNRIIEGSCFSLDNKNAYSKVESEIEIHKFQSSEENFHRRIVDLRESAIFVWYSTNTIQNEHGSLLIYPIENEHCDPFYVGFKKNKEWDIVKAPGSNRKHLNAILANI